MMLQGQLKNNPLMQQFNQMMGGKDSSQQIQTLLNLAKTRGFNVDAKIFSEADIQSLGLKKSPLG